MIKTIFFSCIGLLFGALSAAAQDLPPGQVSASDSLLESVSPVTSEVALFLQVIFGLAIVIILLILTLWVLRYLMRFRYSGVAEDAIQVLAMRYIEPKKAVALVRILDRVFIVGVADQSLTPLGELTPQEAGTLKRDPEPTPQLFSQLLTRFGGARRTES